MQPLVFGAGGSLLLPAGIGGGEERPHQRQQEEENDDRQSDPARRADVEEVTDGEILLVHTEKVQCHTAGGAQNTQQQAEECPHLMLSAGQIRHQQ